MLSREVEERKEGGNENRRKQSIKRYVRDEFIKDIKTVGSKGIARGGYPERTSNKQKIRQNYLVQNTI